MRLVHWVLGGAVLAIIVLLLAASGGGNRRQLEHTLLGALTVGAIVLVLTKAGMPWLAIVLALVATSVKRFRGHHRDAAPTDSDTGAARGTRPARATKSRMTREEAYRVLGLSPGATRDEIVAEYRRLMKRVHPDQGGTTYLAAQLNEAKDCLLG